MKHKKRVHKRRKLKLKRVFFLIVLVFALYYLIYGMTLIKVNNIIVSGNNILTDQEIIESSKLKKRPSFLLTSSSSIKKKLLKNDYIKKAKVNKGLFSIKIIVIERRVLFIYNNEKVTIDKVIKDEKKIYAPALVTVIPTKKYNIFIKKMNTINNDTLLKISEIYYDPNNVDDSRFLIYLNDGNRVYLTLEKFKKINNYNEILKTLGKNNGTLYLDYGNYFESR